MTPQYLFIYGTLLQAGNEFASYLQKNTSLYSKGKFEGSLYDIGDFPGAVAHASGKLFIYGSVVLLNDVAVLKNIDVYEGYGPKQPKPYLYIRKRIIAETDKGSVKCWVYLYNLPVTGLHQIISGDYISYKNKKSC